MACVTNCVVCGQLVTLAKYLPTMNGCLFVSQETPTRTRTRVETLVSDPAVVQSLL